MKSWVLAASLLAAAVAPAARAADIDDDGPPPPRSGAYDDRYYFRKAPPRPLPPPSYNDQDDDDDRFDGPPPARKYSGAPQPYGQNCARSEQVREQLSSLGWQDFHGGQPQGDVVTLRARRPSGRLFELTLHRCTGQIVEARPLEPRPFGPYAFKSPYNGDDGPRYRGRYSHDGPWFEGPYAYGGPRRWYRGY